MTKRPSIKRQLGNAGERLAVRELQSRGMSIIASNYRCEAGEMDLIAREADALVFIEVKTRRGNRFGSPEDAVHPRKQQKLIAIAETYLQEQSLDDVDWRIDVVAIEMDGSGKLLRVDVIENAVQR